MRQALRQSCKPVRSRLQRAVPILLALNCALAGSGCATTGFTDALLSNIHSRHEISSTVRSQSSMASEEADQDTLTIVAADYSPLRVATGSPATAVTGASAAAGTAPAGASGHSFVQRRARLGKPIPHPESTASVLSNDTDVIHVVAGDSAGRWPQSNAVSPENSVPARTRGLSFNNTAWQAIPDPEAASRSVTSPETSSQRKSLSGGDSWQHDQSPSLPQKPLVTAERTTGQTRDPSGTALIDEEPQVPFEDNMTNESTSATTADSGTASAKEPTVLDRLRGLYTPRREESVPERSRKSSRRWTDPFGLLRDRDGETVDAALGATTPLPSPMESPVPSAEISVTTDMANGSETLLEPMIAQLEHELAQWPMQQNGKPTNEADWRLRQTDLRMLYMIAGRSAESIRVIELLPEQEQEFWQSMMLAMESYRRSEDSSARADQLTETLEYVRTASRQLQPLSTMQIRRLNFCNRIDGFGVFSVFPSSDFNAGQPLLLYAEIENYKSELTADGQFRSEFAAMIEFFRDGETEPIVSRTIRLPEIEDLCSTERTDYFQSYELTVPSLSPGQYTLRLRVRDQLSLQMATSDLKFDIRPLGAQQ